MAVGTRRRRFRNCAKSTPRRRIWFPECWQFGAIGRSVMKVTISAVSLAVVGAAFASPLLAADEHKIATPQEIKWSPGPASIPKGAEVAVLFGDPAKEGLFAMRLKFPKGYKI